MMSRGVEPMEVSARNTPPPRTFLEHHVVRLFFLYAYRKLGHNQVVPQVSVGVKEEKARNVVLKEGATVEELVRALSSIGSTPRDIIAILQSLSAAGALESEIEVI